MKITLTSKKGGVGKSTSSIELAAAFSTFQYSVALADCDPNRTSFNWYSRARDNEYDVGFVVVDGISDEIPSDQDILVIDSAAAPDVNELREVAEISDLVIIPTGPGPEDIEATIKTILAAELTADKYRVLLTKSPPRPSKRGPRAIADLAECEIATFAHPIQRRDLYMDASMEGITVFMKGAQAYRAAAADYTAVAGEILRIIGEKK